MYAFDRWLILALAVPATLAAQKGDSAEHKSDSTSHKPSRLFRDKAPVEMWLQADFKAVFKDRDSTSTKRYPATLGYLGEKGDTVTLDVQLATRGHYRLRICSFLPLKVYFDKEKTKGTIFSGEASLKLSDHCQKSDRYAQNVYVEYAIYGMYNLLTPVSLQARLANVTWIDPKDPKFVLTRPAFWMQDEDDMAKVVRGKVLMQTGGAAEEMDPKQMAITDVFQYMIANTDYSLSYLHNYRIVATDTASAYYPMAYDFDITGLVDPPYGVVDYRLPIKRVTDRLYRGGCHDLAVMNEVVSLYKTKKDSIYGVLREIEGLTPSRLKEATSFLDEFYKELNDPGTIRRVFSAPCSR